MSDFDIKFALNKMESYKKKANILVTKLNNVEAVDEIHLIAESELKSLDSHLNTLALNLSDSGTMDDDVWMPPLKYANKHCDFSSDSPKWLLTFVKGIDLSFEYFKVFSVQESEDKNSIISGSSSNNIIAGDGATINVEPKTPKSTIYEPGLDEVKKFDPKTAEIMRKAKSEEEAGLKSIRIQNPLFERLTSNINAFSIFLVAVTGLFAAFDGLANNWAAIGTIFDAISLIFRNCDPNLLNPMEYDKCK